MKLQETIEIHGGGPPKDGGPGSGNYDHGGSHKMKPPTNHSHKGTQEKVELSPAAQRAKDYYVPITKEKYQVGMKFQHHLAKQIGGQIIGNNNPFDVIKGQYAFEVKTIQPGAKQDRVQMRSDSRIRKEKEARKMGLKVFTVAFDLRPGREGVYIKKGVGAFRFNQMEKLNNVRDITSKLK